MCRMSEAASENQRAVQSDPLSLPINNFIAATHMFPENYEKSERQFQQTIAMDPTFPLAHQYLSLFRTAMGRYEEAIQGGRKERVAGRGQSSGRNRAGGHQVASRLPHYDGESTERRVGLCVFPVFEATKAGLRFGDVERESIHLAIAHFRGFDLADDCRA
jgi:hypothetical protein